MTKPKKHDSAGPFRADQLHDGDRYELSNGHPIYCAPAGRDHAGRNLTGAAAISSDPDVEWAGVDAGFSPEPGMLRAPDIAVASAGDERGWIQSAPSLAVEYAGKGQDEAQLQEKLADLLAQGTQLIWVVRLLGPRRIEVHASGQPMRVLGSGDELTAPGILRNPVPVDAFYDRAVGQRITLRNLLQRFGYESLEAVRDEGRDAGREEGQTAALVEAILSLLQDRGLALDDAQMDRVQACTDQTRLKHWLLRAARASAASDLFD